MYTSLYLLISIGLLAGFFMRPLNEFVFSKVSSLVKYVNSIPLVILLIITSILSTAGTTIFIIYLSLKLSGFIPLADNTPIFVVSFFIGGALWVVYAKKTNRVCRIEL